jgi:hypothetical protein
MSTPARAAENGAKRSNVQVFPVSAGRRIVEAPIAVLLDGDWIQGHRHRNSHAADSLIETALLIRLHLSSLFRADLRIHPL